MLLYTTSTSASSLLSSSCLSLSLTIMQHSSPISTSRSLSLITHPADLSSSLHCSSSSNLLLPQLSQLTSALCFSSSRRQHSLRQSQHCSLFIIWFCICVNWSLPLKLITAALLLRLYFPSFSCWFWSALIKVNLKPVPGSPLQLVILTTFAQLSLIIIFFVPLSPFHQLCVSVTRPASSTPSLSLHPSSASLFSPCCSCSSSSDQFVHGCYVCCQEIFQCVCREMVMDMCDMVAMWYVHVLAVKGAVYGGAVR